jgi:NMT1-like family
MVFYRSAEPRNRLSALKGKRLAIGPEGSGARSLALTLLKANGIEPGGPTRLLDLSGEAAVQALLGRKIDAAILMGDSATSGAFRKLLGAPGVRLLDFAQADGYVRRFRYLSKLELPSGSLDLGRNVPEKTLTLIAPTVELVARADLHPALSDLLIEAAREVHGRGGLLQRPGEFPAPLEHEYRISDDAARFYKSGKGFLYRNFPFWLASLADRTMLVLVPIIVLLIPALRLVPWLYRWRIRARIFRRYGELMAVERAMLSQAAPEQQEALLKRVDEIEKAVIGVRIPSSFADEAYVLRAHIHFVRDRLARRTTK